MKKPPQELYGIPISILQAICHISAKTANRWKDGTTCPPPSAVLLVHILTTGDLGALSEYWRGWSIRGEQIISPEGWTISRNDALTVPLMFGQIDALRSKLAQLEETHDALEEQPEPGEIPAIIVG